MFTELISRDYEILQSPVKESKPRARLREPLFNMFLFILLADNIRATKNS